MNISRLQILSLAASSRGISLDIEPTERNGWVRITMTRSNGEAFHRCTLGPGDPKSIDREIKKILPDWNGKIEVV